MKTISRKFAVASLAIAVIGFAFALTTVSATPAEAKSSKNQAGNTGGTKGVSSMDLGSGRLKQGTTTQSSGSGSGGNKSGGSKH